jgi:cobalt-zinc-cadmium resistance protein CzcA
VIQGEREFDLIVRLQEPFRKDMEVIKSLLVMTPDGQHIPLSELADVRISNGASFIYRENNSRYIGVQFSVENRDLASAVDEARRVVSAKLQLPHGYSVDWGGEYKDYQAARAQMTLIVPLTIVLILLILFALYGNLKFPVIIMFSVLVTQPVGALLALRWTGTTFSVSSMLGFLALLRLRPILMTGLVACLGMLPAAMSTGIGSDSQKPFAIVIVGGLISRLFLSIFLAPVLYAIVARDRDTLQV